MASLSKGAEVIWWFWESAGAAIQSAIGRVFKQQKSFPHSFRRRKCNIKKPESLVSSEGLRPGCQMATLTLSSLWLRSQKCQLPGQGCHAHDLIPPPTACLGLRFQRMNSGGTQSSAHSLSVFTKWVDEWQIFKGRIRIQRNLEAEKSVFVIHSAC